MRVLPVAALTLLVSACASERLNLAPPAGVDFSGQWKLNEAESDDPQHLLAPPAKSTPTQNPNGDPSPGQGQGRGGRGRGGPGGPGGAMGPGGYGSLSQGPPPPPAGQMGPPLRYPGKQVEIKQVAGVVSFNSDGRTRVCQPGTERRKKAKTDYRDRDPLPANRDSTPPVCGWQDAMLVVMGGDPDDGKSQFEEQYTLSADRERLVESIVFTGGRSSGFTLSRVWDRDAGGAKGEAPKPAEAIKPQ